MSGQQIWASILCHDKQIPETVAQLTSQPKGSTFPLLNILKLRITALSVTGPWPFCLISLIYSNILKGPWWRLSPCEEIPQADNFYLPCSQGRDARQCLKSFLLGIGNSVQSKHRFKNKLEFLNTSLQTRWSAELIFFFFLKVVYVQTHHSMKFSTSFVWVSGFMSMCCINLEFSFCSSPLMCGGWFYMAV